MWKRLLFIIPSAIKKKKSWAALKAYQQKFWTRLLQALPESTLKWPWEFEQPSMNTIFFRCGGGHWCFVSFWLLMQVGGLNNNIGVLSGFDYYWGVVHVYMTIDKGCFNNGEEWKGNTCGPHGFPSVPTSNGCFLCFESLMQVGELCLFYSHPCTPHLRLFLSSKHSKSMVFFFYSTWIVHSHPLSQIVLVLLLPSSSLFSQRHN